MNFDVVGFLPRNIQRAPYLSAKASAARKSLGHVARGGGGIQTSAANVPILGLGGSWEDADGLSREITRKSLT
jgi:hypothetical protein